MRRFESSDLDAVNEWYVGQGQAPLLPWAIPTIGLIEPDVAVGFLFRTDSGICLLDGFVSRPGAGPKKSHRALTEILDGLLAYASKQGFRHVVGATRASGMLRRVVRHGFKPMGHYALVGKEL